MDVTDVNHRRRRWERFLDAVARRRFLSLAIVDVSLWVLALAGATYARFDFDPSRIDFARLAAAMIIAVVAHLSIGYGVGLYRGRRPVASFEEVAWLALTAAATSVAILLAILVSPGDNLVPRSAVLAACAYQIVGALAFRYFLRAYRESRRRSRHPRSQLLLVFGAGDAGSQAVKAIREDPDSDLQPVAFLDDARSKAKLKLSGLPIVGGREAIGAAAQRYGAGTLLIAMPSASQGDIIDVADRAQRERLAVRILPRLEKYLTSPVEVRDMRDLTLADFLSREEVRLDLDRISGYLEGKTVLVTGAGGSIGSQLCETIRDFHPSRLIMLDNSENNLHALQLRLESRSLLDSPDLVLGDVRSRGFMASLMAETRPDVVFHTAAHKHVTFLERFPGHAVQTNVFGTRNVLATAAAAGVERFVNVSTDKAADPESVLGMTKRIGERLTAYFGDLNDAAYMSVRFGNVLGSQGSVVPIFREQIARGVPVTVTHPDVSRYFMTIREAVQLVVEAGAVGGEGDVLILDMGEPVKIVDLVHRLAAEINPGSVPEIEFTGLRPGEKLHETLFNAADIPRDRPHELLWRHRVPALPPDAVDGLPVEGDAAEIIEAVRAVLAAAPAAADRAG